MALDSPHKATKENAVVPHSLVRLRSTVLKNDSKIMSRLGGLRCHSIWPARNLDLSAERPCAEEEEEKEEEEEEEQKQQQEQKQKNKNKKNTNEKNKNKKNENKNKKKKKKKKKKN
ncbi:hypothetical protein ElyMa_001989300 [Elysia marginata]|uniref:Uncharacterized protein n=1 Tax=Elysia marginata TaxID=1093978 RepID=A0AAV4F3W9_9GAST|nr:hypothetical protein ElyMa_001989300 [Elysia marginata]